MLTGAALAQTASSAPPLLYKKTNLVSDTKGSGITLDPTLVDPWGMAFQPDGAFWINDSGSGVATLYDGNGTKVQKTFTIPNPITPSAKSQPSGLLWNPTPDFLVPGTQLTSLFMFATRQGSIAAWAPNLPVNPTVAVTAVDNSKTGAVYTSLALGETTKGAFIYAANVHTGKIDVFNSTFQPANAELTGTFSDPQIPAGFTPFGMHTIEGNLFVTYAKQNATKTFITAEGLRRRFRHQRKPLAALRRRQAA
ncbi:MAG: TIGR03118 family protein [Methylocella sp.]